MAWFFNKHKEPIIEKPPESDTAWTAPSQFSQVGNGKFLVFNKDILLYRKGQAVYDDMMRDDQVKAAYRLNIDTIVSRKYRFSYPEGNKKLAKIATFFEESLRLYFHGTIIELMDMVLSSKKTGFSITEMIFGAQQIDGKTYWILVDAKPKPFHTFRWIIDAFGNTKGLQQEQQGRYVELDPAKFLVHVTNPLADPVYGESDLRAAYLPYWSKKNIQRFWNIYLERIAGGFVTATIEGGLSDADLATLRNAITNITAQSAMILPKGVKLDVVMANPTDSFEKAIAVHDLAIARSLLVPNTLGLTPQQRVGAYAQSKTQQQMFFQTLIRQGDNLADVMNEQLFRPLAWWNFGVQEYPLMRFEPYTDDQKQALAAAWTSSVKDGSVLNTFKDEQRTRTLLDYDQRDKLPSDENPDKKAALAGRIIDQNAGKQGEKVEKDEKKRINGLISLHLSELGLKDATTKEEMAFSITRRIVEILEKPGISKGQTLIFLAKEIPSDILS